MGSVSTGKRCDPPIIIPHAIALSLKLEINGIRLVAARGLTTSHVKYDSGERMAFADHSPGSGCKSNSNSAIASNNSQFLRENAAAVANKPDEKMKRNGS